MTAIFFLEKKVSFGTPVNDPGEGQNDEKTMTSNFREILFLKLC